IATSETVLRGCHVPLQVPSLREVRLSGGSPLEKLAVTEPLVIGAPQSSTTLTPSAAGHAAARLKLWPVVVISGSSLVGVHPPASRIVPLVAPAGARTSRMLTVRFEPSENSSVRTPLRTPAVNPLMSG